MYDIRKAYDGNREIDAFQNFAEASILKTIGKKDDLNLLYGFYVNNVDLIFALVALKSVKATRLDELNFTLIKLFCVLCMRAYEEAMGEEYGELKKLFKTAEITEDYCTQYLDEWRLKLYKCTEEERMRMLVKGVEDIFSYSDDYQDFNKMIEEYAKEHGCSKEDISLGIEEVNIVDW